ncbi:EH domain-containing protein 1 [Trichoplax sp. H2]|uniref:EF-hand domain-containing protein n=1 Tax=Trichoplax adhaerens TaxID=10228 RepID=B3RY45_TRIAD|nr:expressed hypothetical protein [Trichoplax adhaerens]EDV24973.1 expressed hypothetical protein [Trichoplax adhaerens]RDD38941.1 EH domain-containing protein 1 [Trichoplax sp. H2]|eukprot:XP_002112863.1 expressed hypothetical protein [Trichoplax adhaerens]
MTDSNNTWENLPEPSPEAALENLREAYTNKVLPLELYTKFNELHARQLTSADFATTPLIMVTGQYSTGKTTFINYLLGRSYPGERIGPEPTTDNFTLITKGDEDQLLPGSTLVVDKKERYGGLAEFGNAFLRNFVCSKCNSKVLENLTIIDTPGIVNVEDYMHGRGYEMEKVIKWFAIRADRIVFFFDTHKFDFGDEFVNVARSLGRHIKKLRIVMNKADSVQEQDLIRAHGALMWYLTKIIKASEVPRVFVGSFWEEPLKKNEKRDYFEAEKLDLLEDIRSLPRYVILRTINDVIERTRLLKVHTYVLAYIHKHLPSRLANRAKRKNELLQNMAHIYKRVQEVFNLPDGDFPPIEEMQAKLSNIDVNRIPPFRSKLMHRLDEFLFLDLPDIISQVPKASETVSGGAFDGNVGPFHKTALIEALEGTRKIRLTRWPVVRYKKEYDQVFETLDPINGKVHGDVAREEMIKSRLSNNLLGRIFLLADVDKDGQLDIEEFALCMYLIRIKLEGKDLPETLPYELIPPSQRSAFKDLFE